ncbi:hypothetical protein L1887_21089 [Cichorium endivia]|nr:hypothetical protein L1887_21089 [Cichorium endivia]
MKPPSAPPVTTASTMPTSSPTNTQTKKIVHRGHGASKILIRSSPELHIHKIWHIIRSIEIESTKRSGSGLFITDLKLVIVEIKRREIRSIEVEEEAETEADEALLFHPSSKFRYLHLCWGLVESFSAKDCVT